MKYWAAWLTVVSSMHLVACGSDTASSNNVDGGAPAADASPTRTPDPFNGDCTTANWSSTSSDACWACMCNACAPTLNKCNDGCVGLMQCAVEEHVRVGKPMELSCEVRAFQATCLNDPATASEAEAATAFDVCLIGSRTA